MKYSIRSLEPLASRKEASTDPTDTVNDNQVAEEIGDGRKRSSSLDEWLRKTLRKTQQQQQDRRSRRRFNRERNGALDKRRHTLLRKLVGLLRRGHGPYAIEAEHEDDDTYCLDSVNCAALIKILGQRQQEEEEDEGDAYGATDSNHQELAYGCQAPVVLLEAHANTEEAYEYVHPPVHVPVEMAIQDRCRGTLVAGRFVLFTNAAFKRKQRKLLYQMRPIRESSRPCQGDDSEEEPVEADYGQLTMNYGNAFVQHPASAWI